MLRYLRDSCTVHHHMSFMATKEAVSWISSLNTSIKVNLPTLWFQAPYQVLSSASDNFYSDVW